jgi:hypothetical protein
MVGEHTKSIGLPVFRGTKAKLNRTILEVLRAKKHLASYDTYLEIRRIKGHRHYKYQAVDRRMKKLYDEHWILKNGTKRTQPGTDAMLFEPRPEWRYHQQNSLFSFAKMCKKIKQVKSFSASHKY